MKTVKCTFKHNEYQRKFNHTILKFTPRNKTVFEATLAR